MIIRDRAYMTEPVSNEMIRSVLEEHGRKRGRLCSLRAAYENDRPIMRRKKDDGKPNNQLAHGFPRYIVTMASGYLLGRPVVYQSREQEDALQALTEAYKRADVQSVDAELSKDAGIYGKGVELIYADENANPRSAALDVENAFVVYDDTVENKPLFGLRYQPQITLGGEMAGYRIWIYTDNAVWEYRAEELDGPYRLTGSEAHYFGGVPMVEYWNSEDEMGDFEGVLTLINAYDTLQSDRVNDKEQFVDALLVLTGCRLETNENGETPAQQLRKEKLLYLPDSDAKAEYLARTLNENDVEVLKDAIKSDIHKFSLVPEMTDQDFASNASGVAMKYKLLGLEQLVRIKERWFREALRERIRRYAHFLALKGKQGLEADGVTMTFFRSLPVNDLEIAQTVQAYAGHVPEALLMTQVPFVEDPAQAVKDLKQERKESAKMQAAAFSVPAETDEE